MYKHVLKAHPDLDLRVLVVWSPILKADDKASAARLAAEIDDARAVFFWDKDKAVGKELKGRLNLGQAPFAWDVYCFFARDVKWEAGGPRPTKWAHQLGGADETHYFGTRLGPTLELWAKELAGGNAHCAQPASKPQSQIFIDPKEIKPITEVLLDKILCDLSKDNGHGIDPRAFARLRAELRRRMAAATKPHVHELPRATLFDGKVMVVKPGGCTDASPSSKERTKDQNEPRTRTRTKTGETTRSSRPVRL